jgi:hypothetical protein
MTKYIRSSRFLGGIADVAAIFASASRVANATENRRSPRPSDLERLGISADAFGSISRV